MWAAEGQDQHWDTWWESNNHWKDNMNIPLLSSLHCLRFVHLCNLSKSLFSHFLFFGHLCFFFVAPQLRELPRASSVHYHSVSLALTRLKRGSWMKHELRTHPWKHEGTLADRIGLWLRMFIKMITGKCEQYVPAAVSISTPALGAGKSLQARKNCHPAELCGVGQYADQVDFKKKKAETWRNSCFSKLSTGSNTISLQFETFHINSTFPDISRNIFELTSLLNKPHQLHFWLASLTSENSRGPFLTGCCAASVNQTCTEHKAQLPTRLQLSKPLKCFAWQLSRHMELGGLSLKLCVRVSTFSWNQYSYAPSLRPSRGNGRVCVCGGLVKSNKTQRKICVSDSLCCGDACKFVWSVWREAHFVDNINGFLQMSCVTLELSLSYISPKQLGMWYNKEITHLRGTCWLVF